jgi:hypothetical protein
MPAGTADGRRPVCRMGEPTAKDALLSVRFDHLAVAAKDKRKSATFLANVLGLAKPTAWGPFLSVALDDGVRLDYAEPGIEFPG